MDIFIGRPLIHHLQPRPAARGLARPPGSSHAPAPVAAQAADDQWALARRAIESGYLEKTGNGDMPSYYELLRRGADGSRQDGAESEDESEERGSLAPTPAAQRPCR